MRKTWTCFYVIGVRRILPIILLAMRIADEQIGIMIKEACGKEEMNLAWSRPRNSTIAIY